MSVRFILKNVTLSFPTLDKPKESKNDSGEIVKTYSANFIMEPNDPQYQQIMQIYIKLLVDEYGDKANQAFEICKADPKKRAFGVGEEFRSKETMEIYEGYQGKVAIKANSKNVRPQIADLMGVVPDDPQLQLQLLNHLYAGCKVNAALNIWIQDKKSKYGAGLRCGLIGLQFAGDGERFGNAAPDLSGAFGKVELPNASLANAFADVNSMPWNQ